MSLKSRVNLDDITVLHTDVSLHMHWNVLNLRRMKWDSNSRRKREKKNVHAAHYRIYYILDITSNVRHVSSVLSMISISIRL